MLINEFENIIYMHGMVRNTYDMLRLTDEKKEEEMIRAITTGVIGSGLDILTEFKQRVNQKVILK